jgi:hypothetical protein
MKSTLNKCQGAIGKETTKFLQRGDLDHEAAALPTLGLRASVL